MTDLKNDILAKTHEKFWEFKSNFINEIKDQIKNEVSKSIREEIRKQKKLELAVAVL